MIGPLTAEEARTVEIARIAASPDVDLLLAIIDRLAGPRDAGKEPARRQLAEEIAGALFVNGQGQHAERLVLTMDGPPKRDLGGWSLKPAIDAIEKALEGKDFEAGRKHGEDETRREAMCFERVQLLSAADLPLDTPDKSLTAIVAMIKESGRISAQTEIRQALIAEAARLDALDDDPHGKKWDATGGPLRTFAASLIGLKR